jgi:hypothetical protein
MPGGAFQNVHGNVPLKMPLPGGPPLRKTEPDYLVRRIK